MPGLPIQHQFFQPKAGLGNHDVDAAAMPHPDKGAVAGDGNAAGVGGYVVFLKAQVLGQRPQECLSGVQKHLFVAIGTTLPLAPDVAEVTTEQTGQLAHILFLRLHRHFDVLLQKLRAQGHKNPLRSIFLSGSYAAGLISVPLPVPKTGAFFSGVPGMIFSV